MKFIQVNKANKCPVCKNYTLNKSHGYRMIGNNKFIVWNYCCSNCKAKFVEEKK